MKIGLIGFGNIGKGVEELVFKQRACIKKRFGQDLSIHSILIKDASKKREAFDKNIIFTDRFEDLLENEEIEALVEVTATKEEAFDYISRGLRKGKHIITANKAVVSKYFEEISALADQVGKGFLYEASVGGGVHIIKSIHEDLHLNELKYVRGILNGTCNFILSKLEDEGLDYAEVLKEAQDLGYAEPDPSADVDGIDTQRKTRILSSLIMGGKVDEGSIDAFGISGISGKDIKIFKEKSLSVKLIGEGLIEEGKYFATVMPTLFPKGAIFSNIKAATNMISYYGNNIGEVSFVGPGAGRYPTADALMRDIVDAMQGSYIAGDPLGGEKIEISNGQLSAVYYLRVPKALEEKALDLADEKYDLGDDIAIFTKEMRLEAVLDLIKGLKKEDFFLAKLLKEDK